MADEFAAGGIIKIFVGPEKKEFIVHKKLVCAHSGFFEGCVGNQNFLEGTSGEVHLVDDEVVVFSLILNWFYLFDLAAPQDINSEMVCVKAYLLADRLLMPRCKDDILDAIRKYHRDHTVSAITFESLPPEVMSGDTPLRLYYRDQFAHDLVSSAEAFFNETDKKLRPAEKILLAEDNDFAVEILEKVLQIMRYGMSTEDPSRNKGCSYHTHDKDNPYTTCNG